MFKPVFEEVKKLAGTYNKIPVSLEMYMDFYTPIAVLSRIRENHDRYFLLESMEGGEKLARYTFIGFHPKESFYVKNGKAFYTSSEVVKQLEGNPVECLKKLMSSYSSPEHLELPPFTGGAVGYFGYDMVRYSEKIPEASSDELEAGDMNLMFFDELIAFDHVKQKIYLIVNLTVQDENQMEELEEAYAEAGIRLREIKDFISKPVKMRKVQFNEKVHFESNMTKEEFMAKVEKAKAYIAGGDIFQVVPSQIFKARLESQLFDVYRVLRIINPSPYMYLMKFEDLQLAGASPETLVKVQGKTVTTMPIAGTRPRGKTEEEEQILQKELLSDEKELAEHNMLVDLARNDIGRISEIDSVEITEYMALQKFSHVTHITSTVQGKIRDGFTSIDALRSILPAGTLSGAPKVRAMEIIQELEGSKRGIYGGAIGYVGYDGNLDTCIAIRTIVKKDGMAYVQAGGGVVLDSDPAAEYQESVNKASALFDAVRKVREMI